MCILKIKGKNKRYVCICPDESCNAYVFSHLSSYFSWLICYIGNVFLMYFLYFFTRDNIAKKNAYVCCFQSKRKPKNSYVYSCRDKETRMCIVLCKPQKQMYQCILPQTLKTIEKGTRFCATFAVSSRSFGCAVERLAAVIFSLLFFVLAVCAEGIHMHVQCLPWVHPISNFDRCRAGQAEKRGEIAAIWQLHEKKPKNNVFPRNEKMQN